MLFFRRLFLFLVAATLLFSFREGFSQTERSSGRVVAPPLQLPVPVQVSFYLWDFRNVNEREQTFVADIYLTLQWKDERLAFQGNTADQVYIEEAASDMLKEIWWPEPDFINSSAVDVRNKTLTISSDGTVEYFLKMTATFFAKMDFRKFPFDEQRFEVSMESFLWDKETLRFTVNPNDIGFMKNESFGGLYLVSVEGSVTDKEYPFMEGEYSDFTALMHLKRGSGFFLYQVLVPLIIVLGTTCCMFYLDLKDLSTRLYLGQGCILVFVAMRFMVNQQLPKIDYLTLVDYIFFFAYFCCGVSVAYSVIDYFLWKKKNPLSIELNKSAVWVPLILFCLLYVLLLFFEKII